MEPAYDRERRLMPILLDMERFGIRVDAEKLHRDLAKYEDAFTSVSLWVLRSTGTFCNLDSASDLIEALDKAGMLDRSKLSRTPTGKEGTSKDDLINAVTDPTMLAMLSYRASLGTCLKTFMEPWDKVAQRTGRIYTKWNSVRGEYGGARTGRLSSIPNMQNIPKTFKPLFDHEAPGAGLPPCPIEIPRVPNMREYIVPDDGQVMIALDYSQQELRILAHFGDGGMLEEYQKNPRLDAHTMAQKLINERTGQDYARGPVKTLGFGIVYGMGVGKLADSTGLPLAAAKDLKDAYLETFPEVKDLMDELKRMAKRNEAFTTWGGREYYCEPPLLIGKKIITWEYKMLNVLIQGSAADCTKEAVCRFVEAGARWPMLILAHDEIIIQAPKDEATDALSCLKAAMESIEFEVPMLTEAKMSGESWARMEKV